MHGPNVTENSEVPSQMPPIKGGVRAWTSLFSVAYLCNFSSERFNVTAGIQVSCVYTYHIHSNIHLLLHTHQLVS